VARDGGIFAYGDAPFVGSAASEGLQSPIVGMAAPATGSGYWLAARDGTVEPFGVADLKASSSGGPTSTSGSPVVGIAALPTGNGYWLVRGESPVFSTASSGPQVQAIQQRLLDLGYWLGTADGHYGDLTMQAVYAFQKTNGLPITGRVDTATASALGRASRPAPKSTSGNLVEIDKTRQVIFFVRNGKTLWVFNTSTGTEKPYTYEGVRYMADTPPGRFSFSRAVDGYDKGPLGQLYRPRYFHPDGIAIHGYTEVPPYPASHGCARVTNAAIDFIWAQNLAPLGSPIWVYGTSPTR
jgi:peptidoglycan hydrolase-like protein with peptidoglycan-binding domain